MSHDGLVEVHSSSSRHRRWIAALGRFWFDEAPATRLAALRVLAGGYVLWHVGLRYSMLAEIARADDALFEPVGAAAFLDEPISAVVFELIVVATLVFNVLFILGSRYRTVGPVFGVLLMFVMCYRNSWSMVYHTQNLAVLHVLILGFAPAADAWSFDAARRKRGFVTLGETLDGPQSAEDGPTLAGWKYGWPIKLMIAVTLAAYFVTGFAKVAGPLGWAWAGGAALRDQVAVDALRKEVLAGEASSLAFTLYPHEWLFMLAGVGTLVLELGAPLALVHRRIGWLWCAAVYPMHVGIYFVMGITFSYQLSGVMFASFFALERLGQRARSDVRRVVTGRMSEASSQTPSVQRSDADAAY